MPNFTSYTLPFIQSHPKNYVILQAVETNGTINFEMSGLRTDPDYIEWFTKSLIVHPFLTTTVMPISVLVVLNYLIYR